jgi:hypothetical protein
VGNNDRPPQGFFYTFAAVFVFSKSPKLVIPPKAKYPSKVIFHFLK